MSDSISTLKSAPDSQELNLLREGGQQVVADLFSKYRGPLERMVTFRLDRRLYGRIDAADVLQDAYLEVARRVDDYLEDPAVSFFVWVRQISWQTLLMMHRRHLGAQMRNAGIEVSMRRGNGANTSASLAAQLIGHITSPSGAAMRGERYDQLRAALEKMDKIDREVLALRHFEHLGNKQVAEVLGISLTASSNRYIRALKRLKEIVESLPDFSTEIQSATGS